VLLPHLKKGFIFFKYYKYDLIENKTINMALYFKQVNIAFGWLYIINIIYIIFILEYVY
jgi:hypothetical protein